MRPQVVTTISSSWAWSWALRKGCRKSLPVSVVLNSLLVYSPLKRGAAFWQGKHAFLIWRQQQINLKKKKPIRCDQQKSCQESGKKKEINILYLQVAASFLVPWKGYFKAPQQKPESELPSKWEQAGHCPEAGLTTFTSLSSSLPSELTAAVHQSPTRYHASYSATRQVIQSHFILLKPATWLPSL